MRMRIRARKWPFVRPMTGPSGIEFSVRRGPRALGVPRHVVFVNSVPRTPAHTCLHIALNVHISTVLHRVRWPAHRPSTRRSAPAASRTASRVASACSSRSSRRTGPRRRRASCRCATATTRPSTPPRGAALRLPRTLILRPARLDPQTPLLTSSREPRALSSASCPSSQLLARRLDEV